MSIWNVINLAGGLAMFIFGMNLMSDGLKLVAGSYLKKILEKLTQNRIIAMVVGAGLTALIQSSNAMCVMVVGFVNSGIMTLRQAIGIIMGANVGTTITAWILSLTGIESSNIFVSLLKPSSFTPILALTGIILLMRKKNSKSVDTGMIFLGFAVLMFGMEAMSDAVSPLRDVPQFQHILTMFSNPILGVLAGAVLTGIIQSSSASVGILQALASTGAVSYGSAIPIIMGQNIGTCVTALISSIGTNKNARERMHNASTIAGMAFTNAFLGINHSLAHKIGAEFHLPHGRINAILLPYVIRYNSQMPTKFVSFPKYEYFIADQKYADLSRRMNFPAYTNEEGVNSLIEEIKKLNNDLNIPKSFKEAGIDEQEFLAKVDILADRAFEDQCTTANPRLPLVSELKQILLDSYYGN